MTNKALACTALLVTTLMAACSGGGSPTPPPQSIITYGDSRCYQVTDGYPEDRYPELMGIDYDCASGRTLVSLVDVDKSYDLVIFDLGYNDAVLEVPIEQLGARLTNLIQGVNHLCVLPSWGKHDVTLVRDEIIRVCGDRAVDLNIQPYAEDGIHYTKANHLEMADYLQREIQRL